MHTPYFCFCWLSLYSDYDSYNLGQMEDTSGKRKICFILGIFRTCLWKLEGTHLWELDKWVLRLAGSPTEVLSIVINWIWKRRLSIGIPCSFTPFLARCCQANFSSRLLNCTPTSLVPLEIPGSTLNKLLIDRSLYLRHHAKSFIYIGWFNSYKYFCCCAHISLEWLSWKWPL